MKLNPSHIPKDKRDCLTAEVAEYTEETGKEVISSQSSVVRPFVASEPVSDVKDNVAHKVRRYKKPSLFWSQSFGFHLQSTAFHRRGRRER